MAHSMIWHGRVVWWPDRVNIGKKAMLIRADASPRDEIWRFIKTLVSIFLTKYKAWADEREDMEELEAMCYTAAYCRLLRIVRTGQYRKDLSFYLNCRSAVLGSCFNTYKVWLRDMQERANLVDGTATLTDEDHNNTTYFDLKASDKVPKLRTDAEYKSKRIDWRDAVRQGDKLRALHDQSEDDYTRYCEECAELGTTPVDKVVFVTKSYTEQEQKMLQEYEPYKVYQSQKRWLEKAKKNPDYKFNRRAYNKAYYEQHKEEINAKRRKKTS